MHCVCTCVCTCVCVCVRVCVCVCVRMCVCVCVCVCVDVCPVVLLYINGLATTVTLLHSQCQGQHHHHNNKHSNEAEKLASKVIRIVLRAVIAVLKAATADPTAADTTAAGHQDPSQEQPQHRGENDRYVATGKLGSCIWFRLVKDSCRRNVQWKFTLVMCACVHITRDVQ